MPSNNIAFARNYTDLYRFFGLARGHHVVADLLLLIERIALRRVQAEVRSEVGHVLGLGELGHLGFVHREFLSSNVVLKQEHPCEIPWTNPWTNHPARSAIFRERVVCRKSRHTTIDLRKRCILG